MKLPIRAALYAVLLLGTPLAAWWFVFRPANEHHNHLREQIQQKQQKLDTLNRLVGKVGDLQKEIDALQEAVSFFESKLPPEKEIHKVLQETWRLARTGNMVTTSIRPVPSGGPRGSLFGAGAHSEQPILMEVEGDFKGFYTFLQELERQPRIMRISEMKIERVGKMADGQIKAKFKMSVFFESGGVRIAS